MKTEKPHNYVYLLKWDIFIYIGCRSSWQPPNIDRYKGSGVAILSRWFGDDEPEKIILADFQTAKEARLEEARYLKLLVGHKLVMNLKKTRINLVTKDSIPSTAQLFFVQRMLLESEVRFLKEFPEDAGSMSFNPNWKEGVGFINLKTGLEVAK